ncbi:hypothetical protein ACQP2F_28785 [Actinoplanes sp. CA-030573]|uniref:hypothetical protein n=1 Tax=Actinoplanes sp. CA-030573 TaxID=3239898 RepID=UPI003D8C6855
MRRPVMYLAGLLLATGASLALAGPASAAPSHDVKCHHHNHHSDWFWYDDDEGDYSSFDNSGDFQSHNRGFFLLSNNNGRGGLLGGLL